MIRMLLLGIATAFLTAGAVLNSDLRFGYLFGALIGVGAMLKLRRT